MVQHKLVSESKCLSTAVPELLSKFRNCWAVLVHLAAAAVDPCIGSDWYFYAPSIEAADSLKLPLVDQAVITASMLWAVSQALQGA